ncbi:hypothetical protein RJT34_16434 [Clitoria ternatea]|uniref:Uncharacterized protein n=1 Tax=Clitoria ternatea TaxID=43366 RepID=A0AAN9J8P1_CLITE
MEGLAEQVVETGQEVGMPSHKQQGETVQQAVPTPTSDGGGSQPTDTQDVAAANTTNRKEDLTQMELGKLLLFGIILTNYLLSWVN